MKRNLLQLLALTAALWLAPATAIAAPDVQPSERVQSAVVVRSAPTTSSQSLARLRPGESVDLLSDVPGWYRVQLDDGRIGFVSKRWTVVVAEAAVVEDRYRVHFVDVGTGLATLVEGPDFTLIYDGGSNDDLARGSGNRLLAYLRRVRPDLQVIDHVILSHPHRDHVEHLPDLFDAYQIRNVWDSGRIHDICGYREFLKRVEVEPGVSFHDTHAPGGSHIASLPPKLCYGQVTALSVTIPHAQNITRKMVVPLGIGAQMTFLHADPTCCPDPNENSVVVRLDLGSNRLLFMGDAEASRDREVPAIPPRPDSIEGQLLTCCLADIRADLLVAGHHGSKTSSRVQFLDAVDAKVFVVSSGSHPYGSVTLPDPVVVDELDDRGVVWRTDFDDPQCRTDVAKIGPDNDNKLGGCDNILIRIPSAGAMVVNYERIHD